LDDSAIALALDPNPCGAANNAMQPFYIVGIKQDVTTKATRVSWSSCTNLFYRVLSAEELNTNTWWSTRQFLWGASNTNVTSWTDATTSNVVQRFYKVARTVPVAVAAGEEHSLALRPDGGLWSWGASGAGRLGDGSGNDHWLPTRVKHG